MGFKISYEWSTTEKEVGSLPKKDVTYYLRGKQKTKLLRNVWNL